MGTTWLRRLALLAALSVVMAACGDGGDTEGGAPAQQATGGEEAAPQGDSDGVLQLGYIFPETGQLAFLGPPQIQAAQYARQQINDAGGVLGQQLPEIVASDEAGDEAIANQSADRLLASNVDAIIGAAGSGMSLAIIDKVTGAGVVQCSGSNTAPTFTDYDDGGFYFRTAPSDALQGPVLAEQIVADGAQNVAVVARADDYGQGLLDATANALEEAGATVAVRTTYDPNATNFDAVVQEVAGANPDAVAVIAFEEGAQILQAMIEQNLTPEQIGLYGADGMRSADLPGLVAPGNPGILAGMKGTAPAPAEDPGFLEGLRAFAPDLAETTFAGQVFDCVNIIALAAEVAGTDDPTVFKDDIVGVTREGTACGSFEECKALIDQGQDIDFNGASGPLDFADNGEPGTASIEVYTFNDQGAIETLDTVQTEPLE
jgi:branched-chain amino acid transport system substrate-binding protein